MIIITGFYSRFLEAFEADQDEVLPIILSDPTPVGGRDDNDLAGHLSLGGILSCRLTLDLEGHWILWVALLHLKIQILFIFWVDVINIYINKRFLKFRLIWC